MAYFLPTWRIRRAITRVARAGGSVELILAGKSDVTLAQLAGRSLYRRFLRAGVRIFEYEPQILHMKLIIVDGIVYVGSANLDQRSLKINYELMVRFENARMAEEAADLFARAKTHSREIKIDEWRARSLWQRMKQRLAYFLLVRMDPRIARLRS
jgi:cardiolipin synthase